MPFSVKSLDPGACENYYAIPNESEALNWNNLNYSNGRFKLVFEGHILHSGEIILYKK